MLTDQAIIQQFIIHLKELEKSNKTIDSYIADIQQFLDMMQKPLQEINKFDLIMYKDRLTEDKFKPTSINRKLSSIRQFFSYVEKNIQFKNEKIQAKQFIDEDRMMTLEDVEAMAQVAERERDLRTLALIYGLLYTGMRVSELLSLKVSDIHKDTILVRGKGKKYRDVFIPEKLRPHLERYLRVREDTGDGLFTGQRGNLTRATVHSIMKQYAKKAGINSSKVFPHNFRHLYCLTLVKRGVSLDTVADLAGHTDINTTRIYTRKTKKELMDTINSI